MSAENIRVMIRVRPSSGKSVVERVGSTTLVPIEDNGDRRKEMHYDHVFPDKTSQTDVFERIGAPTVERIIKGENGTVFAYGQTASGKTHSMLGPGSGHSCLDPSGADYQERGLIPRMTEALFEQLKAKGDAIEYEVKLSLFEIYNEELVDLLPESGAAKKVRFQGSGDDFKIKGLGEWPLRGAKDVLDLMQRGTSRRHVASTAMNERSSRSHTIVQIWVRQKDKAQAATMESQLNLVDLAGSERVGKTKATGATAQEGMKINLSLTTLGKVITQLCKGAKHVSFRDSVLTRVLQNSLGGNSVTTLLCAMHAGREHFGETLSTLRFAEGAKQIKNKVRVNKQRSAAEWEMLYHQAVEQIETLEKQLSLQRKVSAASFRQRRVSIAPPLTTSFNAPFAIHADPVSPAVVPPTPATATGLQQQVEELTLQLQQEQQDNAALKEENADLQRQLFSKTNELEFAHSEIEKLKLQLSTAQKGSASQDVQRELDAARAAVSATTEKLQRAEDAATRASEREDRAEQSAAKLRKQVEGYAVTLTERDKTIETMRKGIAEDVVKCVHDFNLDKSKKERILAVCSALVPEQKDAIQELAGRLYNGQAQREFLDLLDNVLEQRREEVLLLRERAEAAQATGAVLPPQMLKDVRAGAEESRKLSEILDTAEFYEEEDEARRMDAQRDWETNAEDFDDLLQLISDAATKDVPPQLVPLVELGFTKDEAEAALKAAKGNTGLAAQRLLGEKK
eukprot:TRINITY_DN55834_c0_g1_i1.p1 TRINITY_DN55834_c0_g1~~TRINITY_DN55834_c0_g1_i1.p1  ORF type:complete len:769 (+),score=328.08 TRINITY_DN55834_c0_g1_i1:92-2308(+)